MIATNQPYRIIILDDHTLYTQGLKRIVEESFGDTAIQTFNSIESLQQSLITYEKIDLIISDIELPGEDIFHFMAEVRGKNPNLPFLVISMHKKLSVIRKCLNLSIEGYILKDEDQLLELAISSILSGKTYYSAQVMTYFEKMNGQDFHNISNREEQIIKLMCQGYANQTIADQLFISIETLKTHKKNIKRKIGYQELHELITFAEERMML